MEFKDYYQTMGVDKKASDADIKKAYRKLARKYHPDVSKEAGAEAKFKEINEAYDVLREPEKRKAYDQLGANWKAGQQFDPNGFDYSQFKDYQGFQGFQGQGAQGDFGDFFENLFGGGRGRQRQHRPRAQHGEDLHVTIQLDVEDAFAGASKTLQIMVPEVTPEGYMTEAPKTLKVKIPAGIADGQQIRLSGQGAAGINGGSTGDLYIKVHLNPHERFRVEGKDVYVALPITPWEAALGNSLTAPTLGGELQVKIPAGTKSGQKLRLKGKGMPSKTEAGDEYLELMIQTPKAETDEQKALYEQMEKVFNFDPRK